MKLNFKWVHFLTPEKLESVTSLLNCVLYSQRWISEAFIPVIRSMWPGINGNVGGSAAEVGNMRKHAVQASRFMLQMMQAPLYANDTERKDEDGCMENLEAFDSIGGPPLECSEEGLSIRIAIEVIFKLMLVGLSYLFKYH